MKKKKERGGYQGERLKSYPETETVTEPVASHVALPTNGASNRDRLDQVRLAAHKCLE